MQEDSFYKLCISACVFMVFVNMSITVVGLLGVFETEIPTAVLNNTTSTTNSFFNSGILGMISGNFGGYILEGIAAMGGLVFVVALGGWTGSWNIVAAYLFGIFFWGGFQSSMTVLAYGGFFASPAMIALSLMLTVGMVIMFAGAVVGLFGGKE